MLDDDEGDDDETYFNVYITLASKQRKKKIVSIVSQLDRAWRRTSPTTYVADDVTLHIDYDADPSGLYYVKQRNPPLFLTSTFRFEKMSL